MEEQIINKAVEVVQDTAVAVKRNPLDAGWALMMAGVVMVAYMRLVTWWICLGAMGGLMYMHAQTQAQVKVVEDDDEIVGRMKGDAKAAVQWV